MLENKEELKEKFQNLDKLYEEKSNILYSTLKELNPASYRNGSLLGSLAFLNQRKHQIASPEKSSFSSKMLKELQLSYEDLCDLEKEVQEAYNSAVENIKNNFKSYMSRLKETIKSLKGPSTDIVKTVEEAEVVFDCWPEIYYFANNLTSVDLDALGQKEFESLIKKVEELINDLKYSNEFRQATLREESEHVFFASASAVKASRVATEIFLNYQVLVSAPGFTGDFENFKVQESSDLCRMSAIQFAEFMKKGGGAYFTDALDLFGLTEEVIETIIVLHNEGSDLTLNQLKETAVSLDK